VTVPQGGTPSWAQSVTSFDNAISKSAAYTTATPIQFPDTSQLHGICGGLLSGSSFTNGLMNSGSPATNGPAGALVPGTQGFSDTLCGLMGGAGVNTTPQSIAAGATNVSNAVNASPMASGTMAMGDGAPSGNHALDAINGTQALANSMYPILGGCGCSNAHAPENITPTQIQSSVTQTSTAYNNSAMATGIVGLGQATNGNSGNVAVDAINGSQAFGNALYSVLGLCGLCNLGGVGTAGSDAFTGSLADSIAANFGGSFGTSVSPTDIIDAAQMIADAVTSNPYFGTVQSIVGTSGNIGVDLINGSSTSAANNNASHVGHTSLTTAQSVNLLNQNLLVSNNFVNSSTLQTDSNWSWESTAGSTVYGSAKCVCDGTQHDQVSCEVPVLFAETVEVSCEVRWTSLTYTGTTPITIGVQMYRQATTSSGVTYLDVGGYDVVTINPSTTTGPVSTTTGASLGADGHWWLGVAGTFVVPAGVDQLRLRLKPSTAITAGTVYFDDGELLKLDLIASECVPGVGQTVDNIVTGLYGSAGSGFTQNSAAVALATTAANITSVAAQVAALQVENTTTGGAIAGDSFTAVGVLPFGNWGGYYTANDQFGSVIAAQGSYQANGSVAAYVPVNSHPAINVTYCNFDWVGTDSVSTTDYQLIQIVLSSAPTSSGPGLGGTLTCAVSLLGRINLGSPKWASYVVAYIVSDGSILIGYYIGNSFSTMYSAPAGTIAVPGAGSVISLYCGDKATMNPAHFQLRVGTSVVANFTDPTGGCPTGSSNRNWGWGAYNEAYGSLGSATPANIHQWLASDQ
jgi:hypothetical protein